jgi:hypothetical protein
MLGKVNFHFHTSSFDSDKKLAGIMEIQHHRPDSQSPVGGGRQNDVSSGIRCEKRGAGTREMLPMLFWHVGFVRFSAIS